MRNEAHEVKETKDGRAEAIAVSESSDKKPTIDVISIALAALVSAVVTYLLR